MLDSSNVIAPAFSTSILGTGAYQPRRVFTNDDLSKIMETNDEWIRTRTGIEERRWADEDETTVQMSVNAATQALEESGLSPDDIDMVIIATTTPDANFPSTAAYVQERMGLKRGGLAFDVNAACAGFMYAYVVAESLLSRGLGTNALVIGAERLSMLLDMGDRSTAVLFGDGAGAMVLSAQHASGNAGLLSSNLHNEGRLTGILETKPGIHGLDNSPAIKMKGQEVFKNAVTKMADSVLEVLDSANVTSEDVDYFIPHQANLRIVKAVADRLKMPQEKVIKTVQKQANTSAASIPLALDTAVRQGKFKRGDIVGFVGLGAGIAWGAALLRY